MKIGLFLALFSDRSLEEALDAAAAAGSETVEIMSRRLEPALPAGRAARGPAGRERLAGSSRGAGSRSRRSRATRTRSTPKPGRGRRRRGLRDTVRLAAELGVGTVITFSGCPGESEHSLRPSWVTCSWPDDFPETLAWQWAERVLPYWDEPRRSPRHGVRVAIEPHRASSSTTPPRCAAARGRGGAIGVNFDPSHLFWQGMDPLACVPVSAGAIFHVHAKDTGFQERDPRLNGVLEPIPGNRPAERSWIFRSVGAGHPVEFWRDLVRCPRRGRVRRRAVDRARGSAALARRRARARGRRRYAPPSTGRRL